MRIWLAVFVLVCGVSLSCCFAAVPGRISYQGKLTDASGMLVSDGSYDIMFRLFDDPTAGNEKWSETHSNVQVTNGLFNVLLGSASDLTPVFRQNDALSLEISVEGETLSPRQQVVSAGYALRADEADGVKNGVITADSLATGAVTADKISVPGLDSEGYSVPRVPRVTGISPDNKVSGYSSFSATITGENFPRFLPQAKIGAVELTDASTAGSGLLTGTVPGGIPPGTYDVSVLGAEWDWGTGTGLFTVNTPTPTSTPTSTSTPTPTPTPTPVYESCKAILDAGLSTGDGVYTIDPDGAGGAPSFSVYCDMTNDDGGWTLIMKTSAENTTDFQYTSAHWTTADTLNPNDVTINAGSAKYASYNVVPFTKLRGCFQQPTTSCITHIFESAQASALALLGGTQVTSTQHNVWSYDTILPYPNNCGCASMNAYGFAARFGPSAYNVRWGAMCHSYGSCAEGFGFGVQEDSNNIGAGETIEWVSPKAKPYNAWMWVR